MPVERPLTPTAIDMADPDHLPMPVQSASRASRSTPKLPKFSHRRAGASAAAASSQTHNSAKKSARISDPASRSRPEGLRVHWARFKRHLGTGTAPSSSSAVGDESTVGSSFHLARPRAGNGADGGGDLDEKQDLDEVVVDRDWMHEIKSSVVSPSERGVNDPTAGPLTGGTQTDQNSTVFQNAWSIITPWIILRYRFWPAICEFFAPKFYDEKSENHFKKENWFMSKSLAMWSSVFFIINWVLATAFVPRPYMLSDKIFYGGITPVLTFPIFFFVIYDFPRDRPLLYQSLVIISVYSWSIYQLFFIFLCGYYNGHSHFQCGSRDFIGIFYYTTGLPTIALFGLKLNRFPAVLGACVFFGLACGLVLNDRTAWYRNLLNFVIYQVFIIYVHYMRENAERRLYTLRDMLKIQFRATQKAQVNERRAADSKRRLTSYVFHEVRVPLNTALLAVQNMAAAGAFGRGTPYELESNALEGSLSMMSKVLNDVLDFNRMDSGRFESVSRPYAFHPAFDALFMPLRLATDSRGLQLHTHLDPEIDRVARRAALQSLGLTPEEIADRLKEEPGEPGIVVGDEMRLRQIITNLASNATKFTPAGGTVSITTRLLWPRPANAREDSDTAVSPSVAEPGKRNSVGQKPPSPPLLSTGTSGTIAVKTPDVDLEKGENMQGLGLSTKFLEEHNEVFAPPVDKIIVRIEVSDTGCGIQSRDLVNNKLFSAFNQTEMGRQQGGKGTGLGLALVRQIVKRSGGRLGVRSKLGEGSTFWVELPLVVGAKAVADVSGRSIVHASRPSTEIDILGVHVQDVASPTSSPPPRPPLRSDVSQPSTSDTVSPFTSDQGSRSSMSPNVSVLKGVMDQGGLVELNVQGSTSDASIPTREIGDPSTGTQPLPAPGTPGVPRSASDYVNAGKSEREQRDETPVRPPMVEASSSGNTVRGLHARPPALELPRAPFELTPILGTPPVADASAASESEAAPTQAPKPKKPSAAKKPHEGMPVLVVDDDALTRTLMKRMLSRLGCVVTTAENGEAALELILPAGTGGSRATPGSESIPGSGPTDPESIARRAAAEGWWCADSKYAVCFLDNQMPILSGIQAVARLRTAGRRDFIVGVTGNALLSDQEEYLEAGVDHVLTKPVLERSLKTMLEKAVSNREKRPVPSAVAIPDHDPS